MGINLEIGAHIQIGGELGRYNSLPIDTLIKIGQDFQQLIFTIAKFDLSDTETIDLNNFRLELVGFHAGSAIPEFAYSNRSENKSGFNWQQQRSIVNDKFERLLQISNSGEYGKLIELYPEPSKRNPVVENLYSFVNSFGTAPVSFVDVENDKVVPIYKLNRFKPELKNKLLTRIINQEEQPSELNLAVGKIKIFSNKGRTKRRIIDTYPGEKYSLEYAPVVISADSRTYILKFPLRCYFAKEEDYYIIQSEILNIIGTGKTIDEAEASFSEEFDFVYQKLSTLSELKLTRHNLLIKNLLNQIIEKIEE
mgnify:CR=1 FL=1|jgi:predicted RNase H-like HicB family nuclease